MVLEFDEKGKYFTEIISKDKILSQIQTTTHVIKGFVHVRKGERLSDEINQTSEFLAVTGAEIYNWEGKLIFTSDFLVVNRKHIIWLMPFEEPHESRE